ncbi:TlpA family protein disulfide reductase [Carnobacteriaceae bacterium zg-ZUI252]|nr:TlpA family protein disulfide reductase [Carnobacteriaceae bacterium zg-ZUI252]MBS4770012.1 TlpA family protein disulfide reductase [Carnobacteriaceae bacterium zg-ZUI240]
MNKKLRWSVILAVAFAFLGTACSNEKTNFTSNSTAPPRSTHIDTNSAKSMEGEMLPDFKVFSASGETVSLQQLLGEKASVFIVWASWCPDCQKQLPVIEKVYQRYKDRINFVGINYTDGSRETQEKAVQYVKDKGYTVPIVFDKNEATQKFLKVETIPTMYFIKGNKIEKVFVDVETEEKIINALESLMN